MDMPNKPGLSFQCLMSIVDVLGKITKTIEYSLFMIILLDQF